MPPYLLLLILENKHTTNSRMSLLASVQTRWTIKQIIKGLKKWNYGSFVQIISTGDDDSVHFNILFRGIRSFCLVILSIGEITCGIDIPTETMISENKGRKACYNAGFYQVQQSKKRELHVVIKHEHNVCCYKWKDKFIFFWI